MNLAEKRMYYQELIPINQLYGLDELCKNLNKKMVACEIGSFAGVSSNLIAKYVKKLYCIDAWQPYPEVPTEYIIEAEKRFDKIASKNPNIIKKKGDSIDVLLTFKDKFFDFIYIDSAHHFEQVYKEIGLCLTKVKPNGIIAGHDYGLPGVKKAVDSYFCNVKVFSDSSWYADLSNQSKKNTRVVITSTTKKGSLCVSNWLNGDYDSVVIYYDCEDKIQYVENDVHYIHNKGFKFPMIKEYLKEHGLNYEQYLFLDDDILISREYVVKLFDEAEKYHLGIFSPAFNPLNFEHAPNMYALPDCFVHKQNWCEISAIGFNKEYLSKVADTFDATQSGWGLPNLWVSILGEPIFNIVDSVTAIHTKPLGSGTESIYNNIDGGMETAYNDYKKIIDKMGGNYEYRIFGKIYSKPILSIATIFNADDEDNKEDFLKSLPDYAEKILIQTVPITEAKELFKDDTLELWQIKINNETVRGTTGWIIVPDEIKDFQFNTVRNEVKKLCKSDWILSLDIDERLVANQFTEMLHWLEDPEHHRGVGGYMATNVSIMPAVIDPTFKVSSRMAVPMCRLFKNDSKIFFEDEIHETVDRSIVESGLKIMDSVLIIHHKGYEVDKQKLLKKCERNIQILWNNPHLMNKPEKVVYMINTCDFYKKLKGE